MSYVVCFYLVLTEIKVFLCLLLSILLKKFIKISFQYHLYSKIHLTTLLNLDIDSLCTRVVPELRISLWPLACLRVVISGLRNIMLLKNASFYCILNWRSSYNNFTQVV